MYHEVNGYQSCNSGVPGTSQMNTKWESQEQRWMEAREDGTLYLVTKELKTIQIPIKREQYIQMEGRVNETIVHQKLIYIDLSSQFLKFSSSLDTV